MSNLPVDLQRKLIDYCIKEQTLTILFEGQEYILPLLVQITYFCEDCGNSFPVKILRNDIIQNRYMHTLPCPVCKDRNNVAYIYHKSAITQHSLISTKRSKDFEKTLLDYIESNED